jgi:hypothetical protein
MKNTLKQPLTPREQKRASILEFADVLRDIHNRLAREGYFLDGIRVWDIFKCVPPIFEIEDEEINNVY